MKLIELGEALQTIAPEVRGTPEAVARRFLVNNPEFTDLITESVAGLVTNRPTYLFPGFVALEQKAKDRLLHTQADEAELAFLQKAYDTLRAVQLGVSVTVLPQLQLLIAHTQVTGLLEQQRHILATETLEQTARLTKDLEDSKAGNTIRVAAAKVQDEMERLWDEMDRKFEAAKRVLVHEWNDFVQKIKMQKHRNGK